MYGKYIINTTLVLIAAYFCHTIIGLNSVPPVPEMDHQEWWGQSDQQSEHNDSIRPYTIEFSEVIVNDLKERLMHRRPFTPPLEGAGFTYGFNSLSLEKILDFWKNSYDFAGRERYLNQFPHFKTNIQGLDVHFIHIKPNVNEKIQVYPLLLLHGWPSSVREFYDLIPLLTTPLEGYQYAFELIIPSLPGFGYSEAAKRPGLGTAQVAVMMRNLMARVGHDKFYVHGGDWGASIGTAISILYPQDVLGLHSSFLINWSSSAILAWLVGSTLPNLVVEGRAQSRMYPLSEHLPRLFGEMGFLFQQASKPDTIGISLTNCPAGLAAYILEKFSSWNDPAWKKAQDGRLLKSFSLTDLLDNVMIYWSTGTVTTSMRLYAESFSYKQGVLKLDRIPSKVPTWALKFKHDLIYQPDFIIRFKYPNLHQSTLVEDGGHFPAMEHPLITAEDIFKAVNSFNRFFPTI